MRSRLWILVAGVVVALVAMIWWSRPSSLRRAGAPERPPATQPASGPSSQPSTQPASLPASAGTAVVRGKVVDPEGRPIAGARVVAATAPGPGAPRLPGAASQPSGRDGGELGVFPGPLPFPDQIATPASAPAPAAGAAAAATMPAAGAPASACR